MSKSIFEQVSLEDITVVRTNTAFEGKVSFDMPDGKSRIFIVGLPLTLGQEDLDRMFPVSFNRSRQRVIEKEGLSNASSE